MEFLTVATDIFEPLRLEYLRQGPTVVVRVLGEVDLASAPVLGEALGELIDGQGNLSVQLDLEDLAFIDSTGIGVLVRALRSVRRRGGDLTLANCRPGTMRILEIAGLVEIFGVSRDDQAAAAG
ncbi:MAG TPA: STAS domain-containing protein [Acidimicrobiales bacterium]|nr:STAS domain-containing protein [Acidimicrobiales bacterium]